MPADKDRKALFQSTLPGWGATAAAGSGVRYIHYFNPRSPDGERQGSARARLGVLPISIHAPRMGSDVALRYRVARRMVISIHAPRMGSDRSRRAPCSPLQNFNPRSPDGERPYRHKSQRVAKRRFQSTLPGWGATAKMDIFAHDMGKIIHFQH